MLKNDKAEFIKNGNKLLEKYYDMVENAPTINFNNLEADKTVFVINFKDLV